MYYELGQKIVVFLFVVLFILSPVCFIRESKHLIANKEACTICILVNFTGDLHVHVCHVQLPCKILVCCNPEFSLEINKTFSTIRVLVLHPFATRRIRFFPEANLLCLSDVCIIVGNLTSVWVSEYLSLSGDNTGNYRQTIHAHHVVRITLMSWKTLNVDVTKLHHTRTFHPRWEEKT